MKGMVRKTVLSNGVRILTESLPQAYSVSVGIWVDTGSRDERAEEHGISHFIEHMIFKGTQRRTALDIAREMDALGGLSNAFTSKEQTCYYTRVLEKHLPQALDILLDIFLHSQFDPQELERERQVILQEIGMVEDTPDEYIHVLLNEAAYDGDPLARDILGTPQTIQAIDRGKIFDYLERTYTADKIVVAAAGPVDHDAFVNLTAPALNALPPCPDSRERTDPLLHHRSQGVAKELEQVHLAWAAPAPADNDPRRYTAALFNVVMGGNMSSRLFQEVREKRGLAYSIYSFHSPYRRTGLWGICTAVAPEKVDQALEVIGGELRRVKTEGLSLKELEAAKEYARGGLLLGAESTENRMNRIAKNELIFGRELPLEEVLAAVSKVTVADVLSLAEEILQGDRCCLVSLGPVDPSKLPSPAAIL
jgi:predicted Zn-dependent peptidase